MGVVKSSLTSVLCLLLTAAGWGQASLERAARDYYRVDPFRGTFSGFIAALSTDTALLKKQIYKQTDSTGYYVKGEYDLFNPFSIDANKVEVVFYEGAMKVGRDLTLNYYTYQLTAYFPDTELTRRAVKKDYKKLVKSLRRDMPGVVTESLKGYKGIEDGEIVSFPGYVAKFSPALVSWQTLSKTKQLGLTLVIKIKQEANYAIPFGGTRTYRGNSGEHVTTGFFDF